MCSKRGILGQNWAFLDDFWVFNMLVLVVLEKFALHSEGY